MLKTELKAIYFADVNIEFSGPKELADSTCNKLAERVRAIANRYDLQISTNRQLPRVIFEVGTGVNKERFMRAMVRIERAIENTKNVRLIQTAKC